MRLKTLALVVLLVATGLKANAQRVGLVLSGGGARGVAHVGVLKALEEHDIPIDYIAGTSMGAIIGGMYAAGFSPDSIEAIVTSESFQNWALGTIEEEYRFFYREPRHNASWISLKFSIDTVFQYRLPTNLVSPVQMDFVGMQFLTSPNVASGGDFDRLFVPFRCVAADIHAKEAVVFRSGDLFPAIRASMTYPFVFRPIRIDGRLLFDGGIYNNFPVDVMMEDFAPNFILGSVVSTNFPPPTEDNIRSHLENMLVYTTEYDVPPDKGLVVRPEIPPTNVTDFSNSVAFVDSGYVATMRMIDEIRDRITRRVSKEDREVRRMAFQERKPPVVIDRVFIRGINEAQRQYVSRLLLKERRPIPIEELKPLYFRLVTEEHIEFVNPAAVFNPLTGYYDLYLDIRLNKDLVMQFGGNVSSTPVNFAFLEARYKYLDYQAYSASLNAYFGRFYTSVSLKGRMDFPYAVPFYLETGGTFSYYDYFRRTTTFFQDRNPSYLLQNENFWELSAGTPVGNSARINVGMHAGRNRDDYYQTNLFSRNDIADRTLFRYFSPHLTYEGSNLNRKQFPDRGRSLFVSLRYVAGTELHRPGTTSAQKEGTTMPHKWVQGRISYQQYVPAPGPLGFGWYAEMFLSNKELFSNYTSSLLSAATFDVVPEVRTLFLSNYRANMFAVIGGQAMYDIRKNVIFRAEAYVFQPFRDIILQQDNTPGLGPWFATRDLLLSAAVVAHTPVGPISLGLNYFGKNDNKFSFSFNFGYLIFNNKALR